MNTTANDDINLVEKCHSARPTRVVRSPPTMSQKGHVICAPVLAGPAIAEFVKLDGDGVATDWSARPIAPVLCVSAIIV